MNDPGLAERIAVCVGDLLRDRAPISGAVRVAPSTTRRRCRHGLHCNVVPRLVACGAIGVFTAIASATGVDARLQALSDAPDPGFDRPAVARGPATYRQALSEWTSAEAVNTWLGVQ